MNKRYTALAIALLLVTAEASNLVQKPSLAALLKSQGSPVQVAEDSKSLHDLGLTADVNDYVDTTLSMIKPLIEQYGLDPMPLPEVVEGFQVRPVLITYSAWLKIHNGEMTGLVNLERAGDQMVNYFAKMLRLRLEFEIRDLLIRYQYLVQVMNIGPTGGIRATLSRLAIAVDILVDFNNDEVHLQEFSFTDVGRLRVRLTGNLLTDWLVNPVISVFVSIFDNIIIRVIEINIRRSIEVGITVINQNVKEVLERIDSMA